MIILNDSWFKKLSFWIIFRVFKVSIENSESHKNERLSYKASSIKSKVVIKNWTTQPTSAAKKPRLIVKSEAVHVLFE